jgi:hypothetical protein
LGEQFPHYPVKAAALIVGAENNSKGHIEGYNRS